MIRRTFALLLFATLVSIPAQLTAGSKALVDISSSYDTSDGWMHAILVYPLKVDGKNFKGFFRHIDVYPGTHTFALYSTRGLGFLKGLGISLATVSATLQAGVKYKTVGKFDGARMHVWIVEAKSRKRVSTIGSAGYVVCRPNQYRDCMQ